MTTHSSFHEPNLIRNKDWCQMERENNPLFKLLLGYCQTWSLMVSCWSGYKLKETEASLGIGAHQTSLTPTLMKSQNNKKEI